MTYSTKLIALTTIVAAVACQPVPEFSATDGDAVRAGVEGYIQAVRDGNWDRAASDFTEDAVRLPMNAPAEQGRQSIRDHFNVIDSVPEWRVHSMEVEGVGDLAYATVFFTLTGYGGGAAEAFTYTGKQLCVLRRQPEGTWLIVTDMWNVDAGTS